VRQDHLRAIEALRRFSHALVAHEEVGTLHREVRVHPVFLEPHRTRGDVAGAAGAVPPAQWPVGRVAFQQSDDGIGIVDHVAQQDGRIGVVDHSHDYDGRRSGLANAIDG
jgi:hypothetical protein